MLSPNYNSVVVWERSKNQRVRKTYPIDLSFFIQDKNGEYSDIYGNNLKKLEFDSFGDYNKFRKYYREKGAMLYEADIPIEQKILSTHYYGKEISPINITFFDIEVDYDKNQGFSRVDNPYAPINSISLYHMHTHKRIIFAVPPQHSPYEPSVRKYTLDDISSSVTKDAEVILCMTERELLDKFLYEIADTDLLSGWNSDYFDIPYVYKRISRVLGKRSVSRLCFPNSKSPILKTVQREISAGFKVEDEMVKLFGRTSLDYKIIYEKFEQENKASYALAYIAEEEFPDIRKLEYEGSLYYLYRNDFSFYLEYNKIDTEILVELEKKKQYINLALQLSHMATGQIEHIYGTIKLAELAIINYCHYELDRRVPDSKTHDYFSKYGGAFVLDCQRGEHKMVGSVDVESLYPTGIMSVNASPETIIGQFENNERAYQSIADNTEETLVLEYEDESSEAKTTSEWKNYFIKNNYTLSGYGTVFDQNKKGLIPAVLESWFAERREYKAELEKYKKLLNQAVPDSKEYLELNDKKDFFYRLQYIKKIQLNSLYGCMGNKFFKFFDIRLAETTTKTGREILFHMVKQVGKELDGEYTFPTDSVIYGDTDSCYFKTHTKNLNDAKRVCKYIENAINKSFFNFMKQRFFCDDDIARRVRVENEIISDIGIFVKKKIYLLHLVHKDGYDVDELKVMGHAIKKTTISPLIKETLTKIIEDYFKHHDWSELNKNVVVFKQYLEKTDKLEEFGIPGKVNKVEHYTDNYNDDPKTRIPGGQAAAILWNICLDKYGDKESLKITSQMAVRKYYLNRSFGRFSSIAVPTDLLTLPDWFRENFVPIIDKDRQIDTLVNSTLTNICEAIGKQIPTEKSVLADELLEY